MSTVPEHETTRQDAIGAAIRAAKDAQLVLDSPKTPSGAKGMGFAHLASAWAQVAIAIAMDDEVWTRIHQLTGDRVR